MDLSIFLIQEAMAKDGFVIYKSFYAPIQSLSDESLGKLFRAIFEYQIHGVCVELPVELTMAFNFFKTKFESDNIKYEAIVERNKANDKKGGRHSKEDNVNQTIEKPENPMGFEEPKKADKEMDKDKEGNKGDKENTKKERIDKSIPKKDANADVSEFVDRMYALYPAKCPKRGTSLGKSQKDKDRIKSLLKTYSKKDIEFVFRWEIAQKYGKTYMLNFSTFLNNFPDPTQIDGYNTEAKPSLPKGWEQERYDMYIRNGYTITEDGRLFKDGREIK